MSLALPPSSELRVAIVGVGRMGANMAKRLKDCGYRVTAVYDIHRESAAVLAGEIGALAPATLAELADEADVVLTVVTDDKAMEAIYARRGDSLLRKAKGKVFINCATVSPEIHVKVEKWAKSAGGYSIEACMASSINQARNGTLYLMIGGAPEVFEQVKPLLTVLSDEGKLLRYVGAAGQAAKLKALVNMVMNINTAGLAEGLGLAAALKLDLAMVREVFSQTGAASRVLVTDGEDMQNRDHSCFFSAGHAAKDSGIALNLANKAKIEAPLAKAAYSQYAKMVKLGLGGLDKSGIAELTFKGRAPKKKAGKR